ncbi:MAG: phytoene/squalene synthase family protein [Candidatus Hydrogenedentes bacterium]|nr:phytoene/squalene synthase family protein [Candidatus Hydrogenedentota bacterium]
MAESVQTDPCPGAPNDDLAYQDAILQGVSRTFALTIPRLRPDLRTVVGNAYLLCRIADTIEDSDALGVDEKLRYGDEFVAVVAGDAPPGPFGERLAAGLTGGTLDAERDLVRNTARVIRITHSFTPADRAALLRCVRVMSEGMERFQEGQFAHGLRDQRHLDEYCYHVAGVVGEMLTELFCAHSPGAAERCEALRGLCVCFGQGLQMTNILKDIWDDKARNVCWLPQQAFEPYGFDLKDLSAANHGEAFQRGLLDLVGVTRRHLENALAYTLLIPKSERGIREFCLWALGMAVLTLRKIRRNPAFTSGADVKISRRSVRAVILATKLFGSSNTALRVLFRIAATGLPRAAL